jgi:hypothetical protein
MPSRRVKDRIYAKRMLRAWRRGRGPNWASQWFGEEGYPVPYRRFVVRLG